MRNWSSPLQVPSDAAGFESISQPGASDLFGVCCPVSGASWLVQPLLQLSLKLKCTQNSEVFHSRSFYCLNKPSLSLFLKLHLKCKKCNQLKCNIVQTHTLGRSKKRCFEERIMGVFLQTLHWGSCRDLKEFSLKTMMTQYESVFKLKKKKNVVLSSRKI